MSSFTTQYGHEIPFWPGYFDRNKAYVAYAKDNELTKAEDVKEGDRLSFLAPAKDWAGFSSLMFFMARNGLLRTYRKGVDLGGAEGTNIRLFNAAGYVDEATNVDLSDFSRITGPGYFEEFIKVALAAAAGKQFGGSEKFRSTVEKSKYAFDHFGGFAMPEGMVTSFKRPPAATDLQMDILQTPGSYDFVTTSLCFVYFDLNRILAKVRSLLNDGGVFVGIVEYWWWLVNSTGILGDFPYACGRLGFEDLQKYVAQSRPELAGNLDRYHYFHQGMHPTVNDWVDAARRNGLRMVALERIMPKQHYRLLECPPAIFAARGFDHREVLRDIHYLNPDVTVDDLFTSGLRLAMVAV